MMENTVDKKSVFDDLVEALVEAGFLPAPHSEVAQDQVDCGNCVDAAIAAARSERGRP